MTGLQKAIRIHTHLDQKVLGMLFENLVACQDRGLAQVGVQGLCNTYNDGDLSGW